MQIVESVTLIDAGSFSQSPLCQKLLMDIDAAIHAVDWPIGAGEFRIVPQTHGNGVRPIKTAWLDHLTTQGWQPELPFPLDIADATTPHPGPIDASYVLPTQQYFCAEWETGNISSSHRAVNKMALGIVRGVILGGVLVVPSAKLYPYLTDRIGNFRELAPYFPLWQSLQVSEGLLKIIAIEHDKEDPSVPPIPKGTDGRALR